MKFPHHKICRILAAGTAIVSLMNMNVNRIAGAVDQHGAAASHFEIRGLKGLFWDGIDNYLKAVPWMADHNMNWLMLCYTAYPESAREWRRDYSAQQLKEMKQLVTLANDNNVTVCLSFNPGIWSNPPLCHSCEEDYQAAWRKVQAAHEIGITWIALCLDDISKSIVPADKAQYGSLEEAQVAFVNRLWTDMKSLSPRPRLIFCPSAYTTGEMKKHPEYTRVVAEKIDPEVDFFWTGPEVCSPTITVAEAQEAEKLLKRKPFVWDNYPVNDMFPWRPLLAPVDGRDPQLAGAISGILFNPMKQWELNRIPLVSVADYLNNPATYDPAAAAEKAVSEFAEADQPAIRLLQKYYGSTFLGEPGYPPAPDISSRAKAEEVYSDLEQLRTLMTDDTSGLRAMWEDVKERVEKDLHEAKLISEGPIIYGPEITGGAPELAEKAFGTKVGLVYARPTGRSRMTVRFEADDLTTPPSRLRLFARNGDKQKPRVRITINGEKIIQGLTEFSQADFEVREFPLPSPTVESKQLDLVIENMETTGTLGQPPWFAVKWVQLIP